MAASRSQQTKRIDGLMEQASDSLAARAYFECERHALDALHRASAIADYDRMARIVLPLQEARRQKRDLAFDADHVEVISDQIADDVALEAGCYLLQPPRVGIDGRTLRERLDEAEVPGIVLVREPLTRTGEWPVVALGTPTVRVYVEPPASAKKGRGKKKAESEESDPTIVPSREWFLETGEAIGDAAIATVTASDPAARVEPLLNCLTTVPDHEKLHQALGEACREAARAGE